MFGKIRGNAFPCTTVENTILALRHELIADDKRLYERESKRGLGNPYRLAHYMKALGVCTDPKPKTLAELRQLIATAFCEGFGPRTRVLRAIDEVLALKGIV